MIATINGRNGWKAQSFEQVSRAYLKAIEATNIAYPPRCEILDENGKVIAHVSQTGTVWPGLVMRLGATPLYSPRKSG